MTVEITHDGKAAFTRAELQAQADVVGVPRSGTKAEIEARITAALEAEVAGEPGRYTVGSWHGHPNYRCSRCAYKTLKKRLMVIHLSEEHGG